MSRTYQELLDVSLVNLEFFSESIQNKGLAAMGTLVVDGTPRYAPDNKRVWLRQYGLSGCHASNILCPMDITAPFSVELVYRADGLVTGYVVYHVQGGGAGGGWSVYFNGGASISLNTYTAAAGAARTVAATIPNPIGLPHHIIYYLDPVGLSGSAWVDDVDVGATFTNTNPPVMGTSSCYFGSGTAGNQSTSLVRVWQGALDQAERTVLYQNYYNYIRPSRV
jgi:hypothetical protein